MDAAAATELERTAGTFDALVDASPDLDGFCSSTDWALPAHHTFGGGELYLHLPPGASAAVALSAMTLADGGRALVGLDRMWGYARPAVGPDDRQTAAVLADALDTWRGQWDVVALTGVRAGSLFSRHAHAVLARYRHVERRAAMVCQVVDLEDGSEAFLGRRSARFRKNLRQAARRAAAAGIELSYVTGGGPEVVDRARAVELRSWKGARRSGLTETSFHRFYRSVAARLAPTERLRAGFATFDGTDVAYILGGRRGAWYRGLQLSYDERFAAYSLGNLLQLGQMQALCDEGACHYDLGMDMAYKRSWADRAVANETLVAWR